MFWSIHVDIVFILYSAAQRHANLMNTFQMYLKRLWNAFVWECKCFSRTRWVTQITIAMCGECAHHKQCTCNEMHSRAWAEQVRNKFGMLFYLRMSLSCTIVLKIWYFFLCGRNWPRYNFKVWLDISYACSQHCLSGTCRFTGEARSKCQLP